jgi:hypothetical protein
MPENNSPESRNQNSRLGELKGVYHVKLTIGYFLPLFLLAILSLMGFFTFWSADHGFKKYASFVFFSLLTLPFLWAVWRTLPTLGDELRIYEKGFSYKSRKGLRSCLWGEIKNFGAMLDTDNREKITSVVKSGGENIGFAYKMQGLDDLSRRYDHEIIRQMPEETERPIQNQTLGTLKATYHVEKWAWGLIPGFFLLFPVFVFGVLPLVIGEGLILSLIVGVPLLVVLYGLVSTTILERKDELKIHQNGFTYKSYKGYQSCLWDEIEDYRNTRNSNGCSAIKKGNGEWISFSDGMEGRKELDPYLRTVIKSDISK